jgi:hypothetical protein
MTVTREDWARSFLRWAGWPVERHNLIAMVTWVSAEGTTAKWNPLATTKRAPGSTDFNSIGVQNFPSQESGLNATLSTLKENGHGYRAIRRRLRRNAGPRSTLTALKNSAWGTGELALEIVDDVRRSWETYANKPIGQ